MNAKKTNIKYPLILLSLTVAICDLYSSPTKCLVWVKSQFLVNCQIAIPNKATITTINKLVILFITLNINNENVYFLQALDYSSPIKVLLPLLRNQQR